MTLWVLALMSCPRPWGRSTMLEGRKKERNPARLQVFLSSQANPLIAELVSTENISSYGARVQSVRAWKPGTPVVLKSFEGELLARAMVVYCQPIQRKQFALGLRLIVRRGEWESP